MTRQHFSVLFSVLLLSALGGCATPRPEKKIDLVWPLPPDPPRITFVRSFSSPRDFIGKKSFFRRVAEFLLGEEEEPSFITPYGVFSDGKGKVYVTDTGLQVVHIFDFPQKAYRQAFRLSSGGRLLSPIGVAVDPSGLLFVSDSVLNRIFVFDAQRRQISQFGEFQRVAGLAINPATSHLYAVDAAGHKVLVYNLAGKKTGEIGRRGSGRGEFNFPTHIAIDVEGKVYVTDSLNFRVQVFDPEGKFLFAFGQIGSRLGSFSKPKGVSVDRLGHVYVVDGLYDTVQVFDHEGQLLMHFGSSGAAEGHFWLPAGIAVDAEDNIYVADTYNRRVQVFKFLGDNASTTP